MQGSPGPEEEEQWIIWNGKLGIRDFVTIGRVKVGPEGRSAWLEAPYDMVGPFSLDELETKGQIGFAKCVVMSRKRWQDDRVRLREEALEKQREARQRIFEELARSNARKRGQASRRQPCDERAHRETLCLPIDGALEVSQIKAAYRRLAKEAHPDVGGSHEQFVRITEARDALLEIIS